MGGGPAGLMAASVLARSGRSVAVLDRDRGAGPRVGETLAPQVRHLLQSAGFTQEFSEIPSVPFVGTQSAWGSQTAFERPLIFDPLGEGFHVDRTSFDTWMRSQAAESGVQIRATLVRTEVAQNSRGWTVSSGGSSLDCRFLVDARGRGVSSQLPARRWVAFDRLVGVVGWMRTADLPECSESPGPDLLIEAVEPGWWYSAPQPGGGVVATLMTDADLIQAGGRGELLEHWRRAMALAPLTSARLRNLVVSGELEVRRAESGYSHPDRGRTWRAIGDAAQAFDPLAGSGIAQAIRSGIEVAREIHATIDDLSDRPDPDPSSPAPGLSSYLDERARYYGLEQRWPASLFWARRHPVDLSQVSVFLDPESRVRASGATLTREEMAPVEALLPPRAIRDLLTEIASPTRSHLAVAALRRLAGPIGDLRILAGAQLLVLVGAIEVLPA